MIPSSAERRAARVDLCDLRFDNSFVRVQWGLTPLTFMASYPLSPMTPEQFAAHQQRARDSFGAVVRRAGIKAN